MRSDLVLFRGAALQDERLTRSHLLIMWHIGRFADFKTGWARPSTRQLAEAAGVSRTTVQAAIKVLAECGYIRTKGGGVIDGKNVANRYMVLLDAPETEEGGGPKNLATGGPVVTSKAPATGGPVPLSKTPDTNTHLNTHKKTTIPTVGKVTWLTPYFDAWKELVGNPPVGQLVRHLATVDQQYGVNVLIGPFRAYLKESDPQYVSVARFAATVAMRLKPRNSVRPNGVAKPYDYGEGTVGDVKL